MAIAAKRANAPHPSVAKPRDAATLVIVDRSLGEPRILLGKRREDQVFLPGKYVFPGGRVDPADRLVEAADELSPAETEKLLVEMKGRTAPWRPRAIALAAVRETFEETGIIVGQQTESVSDAPPSWAAFAALGYRPSLAPLYFFARAITPPGRPRRYDTRFFLLEAQHIAATVPHVDGELERIDWFSFEAVRRLDLPSITRAVVEDLADLIALPLAERAAAPAPFYFSRGGTFHRTLLRSPRHLGSDA